MKLKSALLLVMLLQVLVWAGPGIIPVQATCEVPIPEFVLDADPDAITTAAGSTGTSTIKVTSLNDFADKVSLSVTDEFPLLGFLSGTSVTPPPNGFVDMILTVVVDSAAEPGFYSITVDGSSGLLTDFVTVSAIVEGPYFTMTADPLSLIVPPGESSASTLNITSVNGFTGTVSLSVSAFPAPPLATTLSPSDTVSVAPGTPAFPILIVEASPDATPGSYFVFVEGISALDSSSVTILVTVPGPDFSIEVDTFLLIVGAGSSNSSTITLTSIDMFSDTIELSALTATGITPSFAPSSVFLPSGGVAASEMTVAVDASVLSGPYPIHIFGISSSLTRSIVIGLIVPFPDFSMGADPDSLTLAPGSSAASTISLTSVYEFSGEVALTPAPEDSCLKVSLSPSRITLTPGGTAGTSLAIFVNPETPTGTHLVLVEGTSGFLFHIAIIFVSVSETDNNPPILDPIDKKTINEGEMLAFTATATDPDGDTLTYSLSPGSPPGASISPTGGVFEWSPTEAQGPGTHPVTIMASDGSLTDSETFTINVGEVNLAPILDPIGDKTLVEGNLLSFTATASDGDLPSQTFTFSLEPGSGAFPTGATITSGGVFAWTSTVDQGPATYEVGIVVSDGSLIDFEEITITVTEPTPENNPPVLDSIGDKTVDEETLLTVTATATDIDGDTLTFSPGAGASFGAAITSGGVFTWTPTEAQGPGSYTVTIIVSDGQLTDSETITITVNEVNKSPVLVAVPPKSVTQGTPLSFAVTATDPDIPATLTYSLESGYPAGASISSTGMFSWTPGVDQAPGQYTVTVRVSDGSDSDTKSFTITVTARQQSPESPTPFWAQYWYTLLIVALLLAGIPIIKQIRKKR